MAVGASQGYSTNVTVAVGASQSNITVAGYSTNVTVAVGASQGYSQAYQGHAEPLKDQIIP